MAANFGLQMYFCVLFGAYIIFWGYLISCKKNTKEIFSHLLKIKSNDLFRQNTTTYTTISILVWLHVSAPF